MTTSSAVPQSLFKAALAFVYPEVCQICGDERAKPHEGFVCPACWRNVRFIRPPFCVRCGLPFDGEFTAPFECANCKEMELQFRSARSAVAAQGVTLEVIHRFKYHRAVWFEPFLGDLLIREAAPVLRGEKWDWLVPVPLHPTKQRQREFNQAELIARQLSGAINVPVHTQLLRRVLPTRTQTKLTRREREANMKNAFVAYDGVRLSGEKIVLIDDVLTTGATTSACARALIAAGVGDVCVWTVARGL